MSPAVWVVIAALVLINAFYVSAEFGAVGVRRSRIRRMGDDGNLLARRLLPYIETPARLDRYVAASQIGITRLEPDRSARTRKPRSPSRSRGMLAARLGVDADRARDAAEIVVLLASTAVQVGPRRARSQVLALQFPTEVALATVLPMRWSLRVFRPFIAAAQRTATLILRLFGARQRCIGTCTHRMKSSCSSPKAATAACSSPTNNSGCTARCGSAGARRAT